jgi:hypothetical protein
MASTTLSVSPTFIELHTFQVGSRTNRTLVDQGLVRLTFYPVRVNKHAKVTVAKLNLVLSLFTSVFHKHKIVQVGTQHVTVQPQYFSNN